MEKSIWRNILATCFMVYSVATEAADINLPKNNQRIQRSFINMDLQKPTLTANYELLDANPTLVGTSKYIPGWRTTHKRYSGKEYPMEFWKGGGPDGISNNPNVTNNATNQYIELNAEEASNIYQSICLLPDDSFTWSFDHATRSVASEQAEFYIGKVNGRTVSKVMSIGLSPTHTTTKTWANTGKKIFSLAGVIAQAGKYEFIFEARTYNNITYGNFIDNVNVQLRPAIEFSASSGVVLESDIGKTHSVDFNIVGNVKQDLTVKFIIDNSSISNAAILGKDYELYQVNLINGTEQLTPITVNSINGNYSFDYVIKYNPLLDYDNGVVVKGLVIKVKNNEIIDGDKVIPFGLDSIQSGGAVITSTGELCGNTPVSSFNYLIQDDDTDLSITKTLNEKAPLPEDTVSYDLILENKARGIASNVILKDVLISNLIKNSTTQLTCTAIENEGTTATCPAFTSATDAASQLFSTAGLALGNVPGKAKFKFTLSNLKVSASDTGTGENKGYVANQAEVSTTSNDINLDNNNAIAKNLYAAKNDLLNTDASKTGTGLFVIDNNGQPLWTKSSQENKAYFPLSIKNEATLAQDYQLYASSTAIAPTLSTGSYSTLVKSGINSFTSGLKIEFYKADEAQCKMGLNTQQITQLNVAANTVAQVCAVVTVSPSVTATTNIWFAIESLQSGLGDVILDAVIPPAQKRLLELTNDQSAQVGVGGTYVFLHRLTNYGVADETKVKVSLNAVNGKDGFLYTLFVDKNGNDMLDATDTLLSDLETELSHIIRPNQSVTLLIKAEAPATATNGMNSQVKLIVKPDNTGKEIALVDLMNTDLITVSPNQLKILKSQLKVENCDMPDKSAVMNATYTVQNENLKPNQCLIYRILVKNMGNAPLSNVVINDMYPAYTQPWKSGTVLPMTSSGEAVEDNASRVKTTFVELLPQQQESLYFGIKLN
ncbi:MULTISPECIES: DUF11 domain-containing protein [unclassified Acinetobacter]|uniref:DUF11 domain-containing protein n=1 Tax=unclassified Acinetobacter TaxID=196816 RepID=UPI000A355512|nr:DUF11 domain-containing protein [Acinetobacter sp. ANC 4218]OTG70345.1 hypothetical protein B9T38_12485 [Acinetobacter sp. ANC 4218]